MFLLPIFIFDMFTAPAPQALNFSELLLKTPQKTITYQVEEALSSKEKQIGLMYRKQMDGNHGMVFYNENPKSMSMWMKNTFIPLDIIFADKNGEIVCIFSNAKPHSLEILTCDNNVALTLELNAGQVSEHNIKIGDKIFHRLLKNLKTDENK